MTEAPNLRIVAVVVAYNRRDLLVEVLNALRQQTVQPDHIVVVDNASNDGSAEVVLELAPEVDLIRLSRNTGGAGGFAVGAAQALIAHDAGLVWLMDDDTVPTPTALEKLAEVLQYHSEVAIAGSRAVWTDGNDHPMNTPRRKPFVSRSERKFASQLGMIPIRSSSFVSMLVRADAIRRDGLPIVDYFIWNDDFEFSTRILRRARGLFVPSSVVTHKTKTFGATDADPGDRFYFEVRNKLWLFRFSRGLSPAEKLIYGGASVRRWIRTMYRSTNRPILWGALRRGLKDGLRGRPACNSAALEDLPEMARLVELIDDKR